MRHSFFSGEEKAYESGPGDWSTDVCAADAGIFAKTHSSETGEEHYLHTVGGEKHTQIGRASGRERV